MCPAVRRFSAALSCSGPSGVEVDDLPEVDDVALLDGEVVDSVDAVFEAAENKPVTARADLQKVVAETAGEDIVAGTAGHSPDA